MLHHPAAQGAAGALQALISVVSDNEFYQFTCFIRRSSKHTRSKKANFVEVYCTLSVLKWFRTQELFCFPPAGRSANRLYQGLQGKVLI